MTSEEVESAIAFLLQSAGEANQRIESLAKTHAEFTGFVRGHIEAQGEINRSFSLTSTYIASKTIHRKRQAFLNEDIDWTNDLA